MQRGVSRTVKPAMAMKIHVKGDPDTNTLGDCPFCHRVLLTLDQKGIGYELGYVDFARKPEWLIEKSGGKVPVLQEGESYLPDSDKIVVYLEEKYPSPSMKSSVPVDVGEGLFPAFRGYLGAKVDEEPAKKAEMERILQKMESYLRAHGPLFGGETMNATDAALAPRLYHATVALKYYKKWELPAELTALAKYMQYIKTLPAWHKSDYGEESIIRSWSKPH